MEGQGVYVWGEVRERTSAAKSPDGKLHPERCTFHATCEEVGKQFDHTAEGSDRRVKGRSASTTRAMSQDVGFEARFVTAREA